MEYWAEVGKRALSEARKQTGIDTTGKIVALLVVNSLVALGIFLLTGQLDLVSRGVITASPFIASGVFFLWHFADAPSKIDAERKIEIETLTGQLAALSASPKPVDIVRAKGLLTKLSVLVLASRRNRGGTPEGRSQLANECEADLRALLGIEAADALMLKHPSFFVNKSGFFDDDHQIKQFGFALEKLSAELTPDQISTEREDLAAYLDERLSQLRGS